jgi:hypothetical protein
MYNCSSLDLITDIGQGAELGFEYRGGVKPSTVIRKQIHIEYIKQTFVLNRKGSLKTKKEHYIEYFRESETKIN